MQKKYNSQTKGYKIDIFYNCEYKCSTDWSKTLKLAKQKYIDYNKGIKKELIKCYFDKTN